MNKIDAAILRIATRLSHMLQRSCGVTNYFVAKVGVGISVFGILPEIVDYFHPFLRSRTSTVLLCLDLVVLVRAVDRSLACSRADEHLWTHAAVKPMELLQYTQSSFWRLMWVTFAVLDITHTSIRTAISHLSIADIMANTFFSGGLTIFYYFIAVDPLPPGTNKLREWFHNLGKTRTLAPVRQQ